MTFTPERQTNSEHSPQDPQIESNLVVFIPEPQTQSECKQSSLLCSILCILLCLSWGQSDNLQKKNLCLHSDLCIYLNPCVLYSLQSICLVFCFCCTINAYLDFDFVSFSDPGFFFQALDLFFAVFLCIWVCFVARSIPLFLLYTEDTWIRDQKMNMRW